MARYCFPSGITIWLTVALLLTNCATTTPDDPAAASRWQTQQLAVNAQQDWEFTGRLAIQHEDQGWFVGLRWQQHGSSYHIQVSGPAGQGAARLEGDTSGVMLTKSDHSVDHAARPEDLLLAHLGWQIPLSGLRYWLRGLPAPTGWDSLVVDAHGRLIKLRQDGWDISCERYSVTDSLELPGRLVLARPSLMVRVIVERWVR